jgi:hypothetical protein
MTIGVEVVKSIDFLSGEASPLHYWAKYPSFRQFPGYYTHQDAG